MRLADRVAIVTGAGAGIGRSIACLFAKEGAKVVVADIDAAGGEETENTIKTKGGEAIFIQANISIASEVKNMVKATCDRFGRIDILVNNAGIHVKSAPVEDMEESLWDRAYAVNVKGAFLTAKYTVPELKKSQGGVIINIASMAGIRPGMRASAYSSSKGAVIALTRALALELAPFNIRVNCINPVITDTRMAKQLTEESKKALINAIPLGRIAQPEDIAYAALYLASDESSMLTGSGINVDGGAGIA